MAINHRVTRLRSYINRLLVIKLIYVFRGIITLKLFIVIKITYISGFVLSKDYTSDIECRNSFEIRV